MMRYSLPTQERPGALFGLTTAQASGAGAAMLLVVAGFMLGDPIPFIVVAVLAVVIVAGRWRGVPVRVRAARRIGWSSSGSARSNRRIGSGRAAPPKALAGYELMPVDAELWPGSVVGAVRARGMLSMVFIAQGPQFATLGDEADDQLQQWASLLAGLSRDSDTGLAQLSVTDIHTETDPDEALRYFRRYGDPDGPLASEYEQHLARTASASSRHTVLVTVSVSRATARKVKSLTGERRSLEATLADQTERIRRDFEAKDFKVSVPLSASRIAEAVRHIGDPWRPPRKLSAAEQLGVPNPDEIMPDTWVPAHRYLTVDGALHRAFEIVWPIRPVPGDWLWEVLAAAGGPKVTRIVFEPIPATRTARRLRTDIASVSADAATEERRRGYVSAKRRRLKESLESAEEDFADGHSELMVWAVVMITDRTLEDLDRRCARVADALGRHAGAKLVPLDTRHDTGFAAVLPVGFAAGKLGM